MFGLIKSKCIGCKIFLTKVARILGKSRRAFIESPSLLPRKVYRKLQRILMNRLDIGFWYREQVRIGGNFYKVTDLLPAIADTDRSAVAIPSIYVIIPVYRNVEITRRCIDSVLASRLPSTAKVVILNDRSPDPEMGAMLDQYKVDPMVDVRHNAENLGFIKNVNMGMNLAGRSDVVLLNSDTVVAGNWLERLYWQSLSQSRVSSVTATSNNATICSFPIMEGSNAWPLGFSTAKIQEIFGSFNDRRSTEIPTAVGFCMYITRQSLDALGPFDADAFGKGYGEENDFCLRGLKRGWKHLQALDVGVFHEGEVSFGQSSHPGKKRAAEIILSRYPDYNAIIGEFAQADKARGARLGALLVAISEGGKPVELICSHIHGGGVETAVAQFVKTKGNDTHFLRLQRANNKGFYKITSYIDGVAVDLEFSAKYARSVFTAVLRVAKVSKLHLHHVMDFDSAMLEAIKEAHVPFHFYVHDYWTICPQVTLTTVKGSYCGEPDSKQCNDCISRRGERTHAPLAEGLAREILGWRQQYEWLFSHASTITAPSRDVVSRIKKYYPQADIKVVYHEDQRPLKAMAPSPKPFDRHSTLKVAVLGSIGVHKGLFKISDLQGEIRRTSSPLEITIFGETDPLLPMDNPVTVAGRYTDGDLPRLLEEAGVHVIWFPDGAPETYSFTLSHAIRGGFPVVAPRIGAFSERLEDRGWTLLTDVGISAHDLLEKILDLRLKMVNHNEKTVL